ncbi:hypothetical protein BX600DRAFT_448129 [Xylariales sp. PMI_506]|nr:hypothetical protein BX600DRAFT_448129 [Xylariales sp. PMI_506]
MAGSYDVSTYLLDRANINDTVQKQMLYYDLKNIQGLEEEVFAPECIIDYTSMFGGEPLRTTNKKYAADALRLINTLDASQHAIAGMVIQLPQPGPKSGGRPDSCKVIANGNGHLVRKAAEGGGPMVHNGGIQEYEMVRLPELEAKGENPWRVRGYKFIPAWMDGNTNVTALMSDILIESHRP